MSERNFELGGRKFKLGRMDAFKQFHIARRVAPLLSDLVPVLGGFANQKKPVEKMSEQEKLDMVAKFASPIMAALSKLSDEDSDKVLKGLLASVEMQQDSGNWAYIVRDNVVMINDLDLPVMLQVAGRAFMFNIGGFFSALPQGS